MPRKFTPKQIASAPQPVSPGIIMKGKGASEPMEQKIGQDKPRRMKSTGAARESLAKSIIEPVDRVFQDPEKMAMLEFMNDNVTVHIHATTNKEDEQIFEVTVNGKIELFRRNETKTVKRYIVDRLARIKPTHYKQKEVVNREGIREIEHIPTTGLRYPFSIRHDPHPKGPDWLRSVLAEA